MAGVLVASIEQQATVILGLLIVSGGAFFTHSLAYGWSAEKPGRQSMATALYLVHYYVGGSLGGFYLIGCWEYGGWTAVTLGAVSLAAVNLVLIQLLGIKERKSQVEQTCP